ncbi:hypothetical protein MKX03_005882 [Papaver bracteatum]|nr:hypothetical protein MKX03_005882 [Papaver bracteatum]
MHEISSTEISPSLESEAVNSTSAGEFHEKIVRKERKPKLTNAVMENISSKLFMVLAKREKAEKLLAKLEREAEAREPEVEREGITEEERYMLKKVGLNMKPFLLLGRGVFDGTIENMHLHWKYRELVKIMASARGCDDVHGVAMTLEAESGGILVAVERVDRLCNYWKPVTTKVKLENPKVKRILVHWNLSTTPRYELHLENSLVLFGIHICTHMLQFHTILSCLYIT